MAPSSGSHAWPRSWLLTAVLATVWSAGCAPSFVTDVAKESEEAARKKAEKKDEFIIRKYTQEIGKFDPKAGREVSDSKVRATNPITGALEAYGPIVEQISKMQIDQFLIIYNVEHGHWPTYDEFMSQIIKANNVQLPVLPGKMEYQYDEENHRLVAVYPEKKEGEEKPAQ